MTDRNYTGNPKHGDAGLHGGARGVRGTQNSLSPEEAQSLLNDPNNCIVIPGKRQRVGVENHTIYVFQHDNTTGYHAYPICGNELCSKYPSAQAWVATKLDTDVKRLSRSKEIPFRG